MSQPRALPPVSHSPPPPGEALGWEQTDTQTNSILKVVVENMLYPVNIDILHQVCVCMCVCVYICVYVCMCVCACGMLVVWHVHVVFCVCEERTSCPRCMCDAVNWHTRKC